MTDKRLKGAPTAHDLGLDAHSGAMYEAIMTNHHEGHKQTRTLGGMRCTQIPAAEVVPGDLRYHYSDQLDAFHLWEVIEVDRARNVCKIVGIDSDGNDLSYWDGEVALKDGYDKFYRPDPEDRKRVEREGFESAYEPMWFSHAQTPRRMLHLKLYYKSPAQQVKTSLTESALAHVIKRFFGRWS